MKPKTLDQAIERQARKKHELVPAKKNSDKTLVSLKGNEYELNKKELDSSIDKHSGTIGWGIQTTMVGATVVLAFSPMAIAAIIPGMIALLTMGFRSDEHPKGNIRKKVDEFKEKVSRDFINKQEETYKSFQKELVQSAENTLSSGNLLDMRTMSYLACVRPELIEEASNQLAISVLQARQVLSFSRNLDDKGSWKKQQTQPLTFQNQALSCENEFQRTILHQKLWSNLYEKGFYNNAPLKEEAKIEEDNYPKHQKPDFSEIDSSIESYKGFSAFFLGPLITGYERKKLTRAFKEIASVTVPAPACAKDLEHRLKFYEDNVEKIDLPAVRGWSPN
jgi:hypothetical protein